MRVLLVGPFDEWAHANRDEVKVHQVATAVEALEILPTFHPTLMIVDPSVAGAQREDLIARATSLGCPIVASHPGINLAIPGSTLMELEKYAILETLKAVGGRTSRAAQMLGISVRKIQYRLREWGVRSAEIAKGTADAASPWH